MTPGDEFKKWNEKNGGDVKSDNDEFQTTPKSSVKLIKNTKGVQWQVRVVEGETKLMEDLMLEAIKIHNKLEKEFE